MKTSRLVDARLWAAREDPGLQSELGGEYTRPYGDCHEHAARFVLLENGEGPVKAVRLYEDRLMCVVWSSVTAKQGFRAGLHSAHARHDKLYTPLQ